MERGEMESPPELGEEEDPLSCGADGEDVEEVEQATESETQPCCENLSTAALPPWHDPKALDQVGALACAQPPPVPVPEDSDQVTITFGAGPLGIVLKRRDDRVFVENVTEAAVHLDIKAQDEVWAVGDYQVAGGEGQPVLSKAKWSELVTYMRDTRPLTVRFRRRKQSLEMGHQEKATGPTLTLTLTSPFSFSSLNIQFKEKEKPPTTASSAALSFLTQASRPKSPSTVSEGDNNLPENDTRRLVKQGELEVKVRGNLWSSTNRRHFFLFNDCLLVTTAIPSATPIYIVETIVELSTAKLFSTGSTSEFEILLPNGNNSSGGSSSSSSVQVLASSKEERDVWVLAIYITICDHQQQAGEGESVSSSPGWKHHVLLGTMHSAVIRGDVRRVRELIHEAEHGNIEFAAIEAADDDGITPLHYACIFRLREIAALLHGANADVTVGDKANRSPIHWAALQLDHQTLSLLLANVFDPDLIDDSGRTPLFLATVEGRDVTGRPNQALLKTCLQALLAAKADPDGLVNDSVEAHMLPHMYLASANDCPEALELLLGAGASINYQYNDRNALALACIGQSLLPSQGEGHTFLNPVKPRNVTENETNTNTKAPVTSVDTIRVLLKQGARPNCKSKDGKAPLHLLSEYARNWNPAALNEACSLLISYGARLDDSPQCAHLRGMCAEKVNFDALAERWANTAPVNADAIGLGMNSLVCHANTSAKKEKGSPSSSSSLCLLCSASFTLFRRQHHCRLCAALVCDDCSKRRATVDGSQVRCCDCCFNVVLHRLQVIKTPAKNIVRPTSPPPRPTSASVDKAVSDKVQLFAGSVSRAGGGGLAGTTATLQEVGDRLRERGQKLSQLSDKSADMSNAAGEFARLAKQLNDQQKNSSFW